MRICLSPDAQSLSNEPRDVAVLLTRRLTAYGLKQIADQYGFRKCSSVSSVTGRMKGTIATDGRLRKQFENMYDLATKSQEQT